MSFNVKSGESNVAETLAAAFGRPLDTQHSYKNITSGPQTNFGILQKIVDWLKSRHLSGESDNDPIALEDILDETEPMGINSRTKAWLENEALVQNPRIHVVPSDDGGKAKYRFKPIIDVKDRKGLRNYIMEKYQAGEGAIWMDHILESFPNGQRVVKWLEDKGYIIVVVRPMDKKKIIFYNEGKQDAKIDDEFIKLWRSISVDGIADDKIEEYLEKHGIQSIQDLASKKIEPVQKRRKIMRRQNKNFKAHNEHMKDILEDYSEK